MKHRFTVHRSPFQNALHSFAGAFATAQSAGLMAALWLAVLGLGILCSKADAQTGMWAWMDGSETPNQSPVYGTVGVPAPGNDPGGRTDSSVWTDRNGNLWLLGGSVGPSIYNDIWNFNPSTLEWTCINAGQPPEYGDMGVPAAGNYPPARMGAATWTDSSGNFWLFGGELPNTSNILNDLWEFDPSTLEWTWMGGSNTNTLTCYPVGGCGAPGVYGTLGVAAPGNVAGSRAFATTWTDTSGNFWLFGGEHGWDSIGPGVFLNDFWEFNPSTLEWTWMGGSSTFTLYPSGTYSGPPAVYGTLGVFAPGNIPGGRCCAAGWRDNSGNLWLFAALGVYPDSGGSYDYNSELWEFNPSIREWAWMGGSDTRYQPGVYGTLGVPAAGNFPGPRDGAINWTDSSGNFWLFGGSALTRMKTSAPSTIFGSSFHPPRYGHGWGEAARVASRACTERSGLLLPETSPETESAMWAGPIRAATCGFLAA
jgi:hypothetical protein